MEKTKAYKLKRNIDKIKENSLERKFKLEYCVFMHRFLIMRKLA